MTTQNLILIGSGERFKAELGDMIVGTQFFSELESHDVQQLANYLQAYEAPAGSVIFKEGEPANYMCVLVEGAMDIVKDDAQGDHKNVTTVSAGKALGEMAVIDGEKRSATCIARKKCTLLLLTKDSFQHIVQAHPGLAVKLLLAISKLLSQRLRQVSGVLVDYLQQA